MKTLTLQPSRLMLLALALILSGFLSACGGQVIESWPGMALDDAGTIYLAHGPTIYGVDSTNGTEKTRTPLEVDNKISFYTPPAFAADGSLIVGSFNHSLYSYKPGANTPEWVFNSAKDRYVAGSVVAGDTILAPNANGTLYALGLGGAVKWTFEAEHGFWSTPLVQDEVVYLAGLDHYIYAIDLNSGKLLWQSDDLGGELVAQPALSEDGILYVGAFGSKNDKPDQVSQMVALQADTGKLLWQQPVKGWVWATPQLVDGVLYFGDQEGYLYAMNAADGSPVWAPVQIESADNRDIVAAPVVLGDLVFVGTKSGNLYARETASGAQRWMQPIGGNIYTPLMLAGDLIVVAPLNFESLVVAFDATGSRRWSFVPAKE